MKKAGAITLAAFYLLLTTGLYLCILHCTSEYFFGSRPEMAMTNDHADKADHHQKAEKHATKKKCDGDEDCSCCKKHGSYTVNENIKTSALFASVELAAVLNAERRIALASPVTSCDEVSWPNGHGPPTAAKLPLFLAHRALLI